MNCEVTAIKYYTYPRGRPSLVAPKIFSTSCLGYYEVTIFSFKSQVDSLLDDITGSQVNFSCDADWDYRYQW